MSTKECPRCWGDGVVDDDEEEDVDEELTERFDYHPVKDVEQQQRYDRIRGAALGFAIEVQLRTKPSREQSLALTKIEEAMFWADAAIARNE